METFFIPVRFCLSIFVVWYLYFWILIPPLMETVRVQLASGWRRWERRGETWSGFRHKKKYKHNHTRGLILDSIVLTLRIRMTVCVSALRMKLLNIPWVKCHKFHRDTESSHKKVSSQPQWPLVLYLAIIYIYSIHSTTMRSIFVILSEYPRNYGIVGAAGISVLWIMWSDLWISVLGKNNTSRSNVLLKRYA